MFLKEQYYSKREIKLKCTQTTKREERRKGRKEERDGTDGWATYFMEGKRGYGLMDVRAVFDGEKEALEGRS